MIDRSSRFRLCADVRYRIIDQEAVVIRQEEGEVVVLNPVGARVLELLREENEVRKLLERMAEEYDAPRETLEREVLEFLDELVDASVITLVGEVSPS